jgi:hypothetical protein
VLLEHYFLPGDLERKVGAFVEYYTTPRYHESLGSLTPAHVYYGRGDQILEQREEIKRKPCSHGACATKLKTHDTNQR